MITGSKHSINILKTTVFSFSMLVSSKYARSRCAPFHRVFFQSNTFQTQLPNNQFDLQLATTHSSIVYSTVFQTWQM